MKDEVMLTVNKFTGIDRSESGALAPLESAYMAENMDTRGGNLAVCRGCEKYIEAPVPGEGRIARLMRLRHADGSFDVFVAAGSALYMYGRQTGEWTAVKTYEGFDDALWDYVDARVTEGSGQKDALIVANGKAPPVKVVDGVASELGASLPNVNFLAMHAGRLFAAGNPEAPEKLYYSKSVSYGDWKEDSTGTGGGELIVGEDADSIRALRQVNNGIMAARSRTLYRISGTDSTNFYNRRVGGSIDSAAHTALVDYQDAGFMLTKGGLMVYDGMNAALSKDNEKIRDLLDGADVSRSAGCATLEKLYFTLRLPDGREAVLEYDAVVKTFMLRTGISVTDLFSHDNTVYFIGGDRYVYALDRGRDYDGRPINAYWETHPTDFGAKQAEKSFTMLYAYVEGEAGAKVCVRAITERGSYETQRLTGKAGEPRYRRPRLKSCGRRVQLRIFNEAGKRFTMRNGVQVGVELDYD